ncbi:hypothetical protein B0H13DRAFT_2262935 [Mycena leptocephala]|nr:hypothetical protein B0H13DRAFT_2262935 [Mycena leptocephala]
MASAPPNAKTVVVLGASYGGARAAQVIAAGLPEGWRLVLIDRNSHLNHVYVLPRLAVLPRHEHKAFIPYDNIFNLGEHPSTNQLRCTFIQATILSLGSHSLTLSRAVPELGVGGDGVLCFDYAVYALGSRLPAPLDLWDTSAASSTCTSTCTSSSNSSSACTSNLDANAINGKPAILRAPYGGMKAEGIAWLKRKQRVVEEAASVLVVGGGALGIQFASDIASVHPSKRVTLLHSRARLLPRFDEEGEESGGCTRRSFLESLFVPSSSPPCPVPNADIRYASAVLQALHTLNVHVVLGERVDLASLQAAPSSDSANDSATTGGRTVRTTTGRVIGADLVLLCTGQTPNTALLRALDPRVVDPASGLARVGRGMQLAIPPPPSNIRGTTPNGRGATTPPTDGGGAGAGKEGVAPRAPPPAPATDHGDQDDASLLATALAEIELLDAEGDAASGLSSSSSDDGLEADSLDSSHSHANELDKRAAEPAAFEAASVDDDEDRTLHNADSEATQADELIPYPHIFAIGDAADAFGALPAGHNAWAQGEVAGRNVLRLIEHSSSSHSSLTDKRGSEGGEGCEGRGGREGWEGKEKEDEELETYTPGPPAIKVSLGLHKTIYQVNGTVGVTVGEDLNAAAMWGVFGIDYETGYATDTRISITSATSISRVTLRLCNINVIRMYSERRSTRGSESGTGVVVRSKNADKLSRDVPTVYRSRNDLHDLSIDEGVHGRAIGRKIYVHDKPGADGSGRVLMQKRLDHREARTSETPGVLSTIGVFALVVWERGFVAPFF